jgi:hypothetical protein
MGPDPDRRRTLEQARNDELRVQCGREMIAIDDAFADGTTWSRNQLSSRDSAVEVGLRT